MSFPNPNELHRICTDFSVDARILTEPLDQIQERTSVAPPGLTRNMASMLGYCLQGHDYTVPHEDMADGMCILWTANPTSPKYVVNRPILIRTEDGVRTLRAYHGPMVFPNRQGGVAKRKREFRGVLMRGPEGIMILLFHTPPAQRMSFVHIVPNLIVADGTSVGEIVVARLPFAGYVWMRRVILEPIPSDCKSLTACTHRRDHLFEHEAPRVVWNHILADGED